MNRVRGIRRTPLLAVAFCVTTLSGCGESACLLFAALSFDIRIEDSITSQAVTEDGARVFVRDGEFIAELVSFGDGRFRGVEERSGNYTVTVVSPSYEPWVRTDVRVGSTGCHVDPVELVARLEPKS